MEKIPQFPLYAGDFLRSQKVMIMNYEERGIYITLLCTQWIAGSIPSEPIMIQRLLNISQKKYDRIWPHLSKCFTAKKINGEMRLQNPRLEIERKKMKIFRKKMQKFGKKGAEKRWEKDAASDNELPF